MQMSHEEPTECRQCTRNLLSAETALGPTLILSDPPKPVSLYSLNVGQS